MLSTLSKAQADSNFSSRSSEDTQLNALLRLAHSSASGQHPCVAIVAGHYCESEALGDLSAAQETEQQSFELGVRLRRALVAHGYAARVPVVLWVNDIGVDPDRRARLKENYALPANYAELWDDAFSDRDGLEVWFESTMRNTASTLLRRIVKHRPQLFTVMRADDPTLVRCVDDEACSLHRSSSNVYVIPGPQGERLVVKDGPNPKCNLILATLFKTIEQRLGAAVTVTLFNSLYRHRVRLGVHVARSVTGVTMPINSAFCDGSPAIIVE